MSPSSFNNYKDIVGALLVQADAASREWQDAMRFAEAHVDEYFPSFDPAPLHVYNGGQEPEPHADASGTPGFLFGGQRSHGGGHA